MQVLPHNFARRHACRISCIATVRTCVHQLPCSLPGAIQLILSFVMDRGNTSFARRQVAQLFLHVKPWQPVTALLSAPPAAASKRTTLVFRVSYIPSRPTHTHTGLPWLSLVNVHPSCLNGCVHRFPQTRLFGHSRVHLVTKNVLHLFTSDHWVL